MFKPGFHQTSPAEFHGGLLYPFHLFKLQAPLPHQAVEHGGNQADRGVNRNRVKLPCCHAGLQTVGEIILQAAAYFPDALATDAFRILETGRTGADRQIDLVGHLFDDIKMQGNEVFYFFKPGNRFFRQVVQVGKKRFKGRCDDSGEEFVFALEMVIDHRLGNAGLF